MLGKTGGGLARFTIVRYTRSMTHIHTLNLTQLSTVVTCDGCDISLRLATYPEAVFVQNTDGYLPDGPIMMDNGVVAVPPDFTIPKEVADAIQA